MNPTFVREDRFSSICEDLPIARWYSTLEGQPPRKVTTMGSALCDEAASARVGLCLPRNVKLFLSRVSQIKSLDKVAVCSVGMFSSKAWHKFLTVNIFGVMESVPNNALENGTLPQKVYSGTG